MACSIGFILALFFLSSGGIFAQSKLGDYLGAMTGADWTRIPQRHSPMGCGLLLLQTFIDEELSGELRITIEL
jgi:hypothetical protein